MRQKNNLRGKTNELDETSHDEGLESTMSTAACAIVEAALSRKTEWGEVAES